MSDSLWPIPGMSEARKALTVDDRRVPECASELDGFGQSLLRSRVVGRLV
jgi:hypothetical protein